MAEGTSLGSLYVSLGGDATSFNNMVSSVLLQTHRISEAMKEPSSAITSMQERMKSSSDSLRSMAEPFQDLGFKFAAAGAALTGTMTMAANSYGAVSEELGNMAVRTGVAVESLSALEYAATVSGGSMGMLEQGMRRMQRTIGSAQQGSEEATKSLTKLGIPIQSLAGKSADKQFEVLAEAISKIQDPTLRARASMDIFGRESTKLLPMMEKGAKGIQDLRAEAEKLGYVLSKEDVEAGKEFNDSLEAMQLGFKRIYYAIGAQVAPILKQYADWIRNNIVVAREWIRENGVLFRSVFYLGSALGILGTALGTFGVLFNTVASGIAAMSTILTIALTPIVAYTVAFLAAAAAGFLLVEAISRLIGITSPLQIVGGYMRRIGSEMDFQSDLGKQNREYASHQQNFEAENNAVMMSGLDRDFGPSKSATPQAGKSQFKQVSLSRMSMSSLGANAGGKQQFVQKTSAPGTETRLDTLIALVRGKPTTAVLG